MAQKIYNYVKNNGVITSIIKSSPDYEAQFNISYYAGLVQNVTNVITSETEPLVTFERDINDEVVKFILHKDKKEAIVTTASNSENDFFIRKSILSKISEYQYARKEKFFYFNDERELSNRAPFSILREFGLENIDCIGKQAKVDLIKNSDITLQIVPEYYEGKLISILGYDQTTDFNFKTNFIYDSNDRLLRMDEYSLKLDPLGAKKYLIDASFSFKFVGDQLSYILCTGTPYKRIDLQYNSNGELSAVYKTSTSKVLWFKKIKNGIEFSDKTKTIFKYQKNKAQKTSILSDNNNKQLSIEFKYNKTKNNVNKFVSPGIILPNGELIDVQLYNCDLLSQQPYLSEYTLIYDNIPVFKMIPEYKRDKVSIVNIFDFSTMTKLGFIRFFYSKNLISEIVTYYYNLDDQPVWINTFMYSRNPNDNSDRTIHIEHDSIAEGEYKLGKYTFEVDNDYKLQTIYENHGKVKFANIVYDNDNEVQSFVKFVNNPIVDISDLKLKTFF